MDVFWMKSEAESFTQGQKEPAIIPNTPASEDTGANFHTTVLSSLPPSGTLISEGLSSPRTTLTPSKSLCDFVHRHLPPAAGKLALEVSCDVSSSLLCSHVTRALPRCPAVPGHPSSCPYSHRTGQGGRRYGVYGKLQERSKDITGQATLKGRRSDSQ